MQTQNIDDEFLDIANVVGTVPVKTQHNEKPIGKYSPTLLREWLDEIEETSDNDVYLWTVPHEEVDTSMLVATYGKDSNLGIGLAPRKESVNDD